MIINWNYIITENNIMRRFCCYTKKPTQFFNIFSESSQNINIPYRIDFTDLKYNDTIPFIPPIEKGKVIKVYDGDTITIASPLPYHNSPIYRFSVRLNGIDCPEITSKIDSEKQCANIAKAEMESLVMGKMIYLQNIKIEKYGRILADV